MKEAFSQNQKITLNPNAGKENEKREPKKKKAPVKKETLQKMTELGLDIKNIFYEEDAQAKIEEKTKENNNSVKRNKKEQIMYEATVLASQLEIPISDSVGIKAILDSIKDKLEERKKAAGNDIPQMAEVLSYEVSYKAICTEYEVYDNTTSRLGVASLADYNRFRLGL